MPYYRITRDCVPLEIYPLAGQTCRADSSHVLAIHYCPSKAPQGPETQITEYTTEARVDLKVLLLFEELGEADNRSVYK